MPNYNAKYWQGASTSGSTPTFGQRWGPAETDPLTRLAQGADYLLNRPIQASMQSGMRGGQAYANARSQGMNPIRAFSQALDPMAIGAREGFLGEKPNVSGSQFTGGGLSGLAMEALGDPMNIPTGGGATLGKMGLKFGLKEMLPHMAALGLSKRKFIPKVIEGAGGRNLLELFDNAKNLVGKLGYVDKPGEVGFHSIMVTPQYRGKGSGAAYQMFDELDSLVGRERLNQALMKTPVMPHAKGFFEHLSDKIAGQVPDFSQRMKQAASMADYY